MASSRKTGTNPNVRTYGTGKTYTALATWEGDTDVDLVTGTVTEVLEVYGNSYDDAVTLAGATTNSSYFRIIRPASGNFLGRAAGIANKHFTYTTDNNVLVIGESNSEVQDIVATLTIDANSTRYVFYTLGTLTLAGFVGCVAIDASNAYAGKDVGGFNLGVSGDGNTSYAKNCLSHNCDGHGFNLSSGLATANAYNCTATNNAGTGFLGYNTSKSFCYGCGATGNGTDFEGGASGVAQTDCSASAPTFVNSGSDDFHLASGDTTWKDADTNSGSWHSSCGYDDDIDGETRTGTWDIGWDEYVAGGGGEVIFPIGAIAMEYFMKMRQ